MIVVGMRIAKKIVDDKTKPITADGSSWQKDQADDHNCLLGCRCRTDDVGRGTTRLESLHAHVDKR